MKFDIVDNFCQSFSYGNQHKQCGHFRIDRSPYKDAELAPFRNNDKFMLGEIYPKELLQYMTYHFWK